MRAPSIILSAVAVLILLGGTACDVERDRDTAATGVATPAAAPAETAAEEEARGQQMIEAHNRLLSAFETGDIDTIVGLVGTGEQFLVFHPMVDDRIDDETELRESLSRMFEGMGESSWIESHGLPVMEGDVGWITYHFGIESDAMGEPMTGRATEIWRWTGGGWELAHGHWSETPAGAEGGR